MTEQTVARVETRPPPVHEVRRGEIKTITRATLISKARELEKKAHPGRGHEKEKGRLDTPGERSIHFYGQLASLEDQDPGAFKKALKFTPDSKTETRMRVVKVGDKWIATDKDNSGAIEISECAGTVPSAEGIFVETNVGKVPLSVLLDSQLIAEEANIVGAFNSDPQVQRVVQEHINLLKNPIKPVEIEDSIIKEAAQKMGIITVDDLYTFVENYKPEEKPEEPLPVETDPEKAKAIKDARDTKRAEEIKTVREKAKTALDNTFKDENDTINDILTTPAKMKQFFQESGVNTFSAIDTLVARGEAELKRLGELTNPAMIGTNNPEHPVDERRNEQPVFITEQDQARWNYERSLIDVQLKALYTVREDIMKHGDPLTMFTNSVQNGEIPVDLAQRVRQAFVSADMVGLQTAVDDGFKAMAREEIGDKQDIITSEEERRLIFGRIKETIAQIGKVGGGIGAAMLFLAMIKGFKTAGPGGQQPG
ncbi:MAG: hypothetical protein Q7S61_04970 [bacterium]|nr:hypothetical protein [bacterium]